MEHSVPKRCLPAHSPSAVLHFLEDPSLHWWFAFTVLCLRAESGQWRPWRCNFTGQLSLFHFHSSFFSTSAHFSHQTLQSRLWWHLSMLSSGGCLSSLSPWSHRGTLRGCAVTALAQTWSNPSWKAATTCVFFQCFPPVWLPVWGGVHTSRTSLQSSLSEWWFSLLSEGTERLGSLWSSQSCSCRSSEELHRDSALCSRMLPTHSCAMFSPGILSLCLPSLPSQSA